MAPNELPLLGSTTGLGAGDAARKRSASSIPAALQHQATGEEAPREKAVAKAYGRCLRTDIKSILDDGKVHHVLVGMGTIVCAGMGIFVSGSMTVVGAKESLLRSEDANIFI